MLSTNFSRRHSMFTQRHYIALAQTLRNVRAGQEVIDEFITDLKKDNPKFNPTLFRKASTWQNRFTGGLQ